MPAVRAARRDRPATKQTRAPLRRRGEADSALQLSALMARLPWSGRFTSIVLRSTFHRGRPLRRTVISSMTLTVARRQVAVERRADAVGHSDPGRDVARSPEHRAARGRCPSRSDERQSFCEAPASTSVLTVVGIATDSTSSAASNRELDVARRGDDEACAERHPRASRRRMASSHRRVSGVTLRLLPPGRRAWRPASPCRCAAPVGCGDDHPGASTSSSGRCDAPAATMSAELTSAWSSRDASRLRARSSIQPVGGAAGHRIEVHAERAGESVHMPLAVARDVALLAVGHGVAGQDMRRPAEFVPFTPLPNVTLAGRFELVDGVVRAASDRSRHGASCSVRPPRAPAA